MTDEGRELQPRDFGIGRLFWHIREAVVVGDADTGRIVLWNAAAEALFGYAAAEAVGQTLDLIIPENLRGRHWEGFRTVMATGVTRYGARELLSVPAVRKDGTRVSVEFSIALVRDDAGGITGVAAVMRDVTVRWQQDRELRLRLAELEAGARSAAAPGGEGSSAV